jgi:hypothetical protein
LGQGKEETNQEQTKVRRMLKHLQGMKRKHTLELARWIPNLGVGSFKMFQSFGTKVQ